MRFVALALALCAAFGCKEPEVQEKPTEKAAKRAQPIAPSLDRPKVKAPGLVEVKKVSATVGYSMTDLKLDGSSLGYGVKSGIIPRDVLQSLLQRLQKAGATSDPIGIALDPKLPCLRVFELLDAMRSATYRNVALLAGEGLIAVPLTLVDENELGRGVHPVVTVTRGRAIVWSKSGGEGTLENPRATFSADSELGARLTKLFADIVKRRWPDGMRADEDRVITVQMSGRESAETLLQVVAAVRSDGATELFPTIYLAAGK